jgi:glycosyltransferase involved in cell wall biosynthesis
LNGWQPILIGFREVKDALTTPGVARGIIPISGSRIARAARFWLYRPDPDVVRYLRELDVELVHAHFGTDATDIWPSVKSAGLAMLVTLHGYDISICPEWWQAGYGGVRRRNYPRRLIRMAADPYVRFVAVSRNVKQRAIEAGISADKIVVSPIGVDTDRFSPGHVPLCQRKKRILFVGRMVEKKAPTLLIQAFAEARRSVPDAELVMIGDGPLLIEATTLAKDLGVPVSFMGACPSSIVVEQLHKARVFCLPSITAANGDAEGLPISLLEAQACGVPCITTREAGGEEALPSSGGLLVPAGSAQSLAAALAHALTDTDFMEAAPGHALKWVRDRLSLRENALALQAIYEATANMRPRIRNRGIACCPD